MKDLEVVELYEGMDESVSEKFLENIDSTLSLKTEIEKVTEDTEWIEKIEESLQYIDNIFRNPNRFIINEEEIVKIELARKITVESIKHLSKNTNLIQDIDKKTGDVRPSKILNINKEESYDTYENRLIYTLVQNVKFFISRKKKFMDERLGISEKNDRNFDYKGSSKISGETVNIDVHFSAKLDNANAEMGQNETAALMERIKKLDEKIIDITSNDIYRAIDKKHITLITPPIKKTNLILKNVNFQYAMNLWNYLQDHMDDSSKHIDQKQEKNDDENTKRLLDETFYLDYLISKTLSGEKMEPSEDKKLKNEMTAGLIQRIISINPDMPVEEFKQMIGDKYEVIKKKSVVNLTELQNIFRENIDKYLEKLK